MKRIFSLTTLLVLALALVTGASAAGRLEIVQENLHKIPSYGTTVTCHYYAELTNSGDRPVEFTRGLLEFYDTDGNSVESIDVTACYPKVLQPGENAFIGLYRNVDTSKYTVDDQMLSLMQQGKITQNVVRLETQSRYEKIDEGNSTRDYVIMEIRNNTGEAIQNFDITFAVKDAEKNILWAHSWSWRGYDLGIMPDSSVEVRLRVDNAFVKFWQESELVPDTIDTIAYIATGI